MRPRNVKVAEPADETRNRASERWQVLLTRSRGIQEDREKRDRVLCVDSRGGLRRVKCDGASEVAGGEERTSSLAEVGCDCVPATWYPAATSKVDACG